MNSFYARRIALVLVALGVCLAVESAFSATGCVVAPQGLISWWPGEGNAFDTSGINPGTLTGDAKYGPGQVGQGFIFDGSGDAVVVGTAPSLQLQDFSIEGWIRRADPDVVTFGTHTTALFFSYGSLGFGFGIWNDGRLLLTRVDIGNVTSDLSITDTNFHHVAVTKSGSTVMFYVDGAANAAPSYPDTFTFSTVAAIGARADTMDDSFYGAIDELSVYGRTLSATEILSIYNAGSAGKCRNPFPPQILTQPSDQQVYAGDTATITVSATGDQPLMYQWRFREADITGQTNAALTLSNVQTNNAGPYSVTITNAGGSIASSNATLTVFPKPPCIPVPDGAVSWWRAETNAFDAAGNNHGTLLGNTTYGPGRVGAAFVFDGSSDVVSVGNPTNLQLQNFTIEAWVKRSDSSVATFGSHTTALFFGYSSGGYGFGMWNDGRLFVTHIDIDNVSSVVAITDTNSFHHVAVTKSNSTIVFYIDGAAFPAPAYFTTFTFSGGASLGGRSDTLDDSFFGSIDELAVYNRALSGAEILAIYNADGSGKCKVPIPPAILTQPASKAVYVGDTVTFNVAASGDPPLYYQWQFGGTNLPGRTGSSLILQNVQLTSAGSYSVWVSNAVDSIQSSNAMLTVNPRPPCVPVPDGLVSWWRAEGDSSDGWDSNNPETSLATVSFVAGKVGRAFNFVTGYLLVPDSTSLRITNALTIEAWINPTSLAGPNPRTILAKFEYPPAQGLLNQSSYFLGLTNNGAVLFMLSGSGSARTNTALVSSQVIPTNQWSFLVATYDGASMKIYINGVLSAQTNYSGGIFPGNSNLNIGSIFLGTSGFISRAWPYSGLIDELSLYNRALGSDEVLAIYSADVSGKCLAPPAITQQPQNQAVPLGEDVLFSVDVTGSRPLKYQWRFNGFILPGATNATLLLERVQTNRIGNYSVAVTNVLGFALSSNATLTLLPPPVCVPIPAGAVSWWPADGTGLDAAGTNNATVSPAIVPPFPGIVPPSGISYAAGKVGLAFNLSNSVVVDRSPVTIVVSNSSSLNFGSNADFSIEAWIKVTPTTSFSPYMTIVDKGPEGSLSGIGYSLLLDQGRLACWLGTVPASATNTALFLSSGPDLRDGMFHHVAVTLNRSATNGGHLYVDGQSVLTFDPTPRRGDLTTPSSFFIGSPPVNRIIVGNSDPSFTGLIDEVTLYRRALAPEEILAIRQAGAAGKCKALPLILTQPASQKVTIGSNATFTVTAAGAAPLRYQWFHGNAAQSGATNATYSFVVQANSGGAYSVRVSNVFATVTSSIVFLTLNIPPVAQPQQVSLNEDTLAAITLHGTDIQSDPLTYSIVTPPAHGTLFGVAPNLTYLPATNYFGQDSFTFRVNDGLADSAPATVALTILPVNDPPVALAQSVAVNEDTPLNITLTASDVENDPLTFSIVTPPLHGVLSGTPPHLTYLAFTNYNGQDSFTFKANDGQTDSAPATVSITIIPVNDAPFAVASVTPLFALSPDETNLFVFSSNNSNAVAVLDGSASSDVENDPLTFSWLEGTNTIGVGVRITNVFAVGSHDITLRVSDGKDTGTDTLAFDVITPAESINLLISLLDSGGNLKMQPLEASLNAAAASCASNHFTPALNQLRAFQNKVAAQVGQTDPALADELIKAAQEIIDELSAP